MWKKKGEQPSPKYFDSLTLALWWAERSSGSAQLHRLVGSAQRHTARNDPQIPPSGLRWHLPGALHGHCSLLWAHVESMDKYTCTHAMKHYVLLLDQECTYQWWLPERGSELRPSWLVVGQTDTCEIIAKKFKNRSGKFFQVNKVKKLHFVIS